MTHEEKTADLRRLAGEANNYRLERDWSVAMLCREISLLGSTKTFNRVLDEADELKEGIDIDRRLIDYANALELIKSRRDQERPAEPEYDDFDNVVQVQKAVIEALQETSVARFVCVEGATGTGKDAALNNLVRRWENIVISVEASEFWRESLAVPLSDILNAMDITRRKQNGGGGFVMPQMPYQREEILIEELQKRRLILAINEAHAMGPRMINTLKHLINKSPVVIVIFCHPKLISNLIKSNFEECSQLFGNRLCRRVRLDPPGPDEILTLLDRRGIQFCDARTANESAKKIAGEATANGNWRYVVKFTRRARLLAAGKPLTLEQTISAAARAAADCMPQGKAMQ